MFNYPLSQVGKPHFFTGIIQNNCYLLHYLCNIIQNQLRFEEKQKSQRVDKKLWKKIQDKKRDQGLKQ